MSTEEMNLQELESQFSEQEALRREKLVKLQEEGKDPFDVYKVERTHSSQQVKDNFEELEGKEVTVAGRIMSKRGQGKVVYHLIIYVGAVVSVGSGCRIVCELLEIGIGIGGRRYEFASHFSNEEILVGSLLHSLCDAEGIIDGVYLLIERWILDHAVVIYTEHILTGCGREESQRCYYCIYYFHCLFLLLPLLLLLLLLLLSLLNVVCYLWLNLSSGMS